MPLCEFVPPSWKRVLKEEFQKKYFLELEAKVSAARKKTVVYPPEHQVFNALQQCGYEDCRVLLLGQDPYHGSGQAHGLSFSVQAGVKIPPSLRNMYKELHSDLGIDIPKTGDLHPWAKQGVLLLNASLTVEEKKANSHAKFGWMEFTDAVIKALSKREKPLIFLLWGGFAQKKRKYIDPKRHHILSSSHPSPLSAYRGFFGSKPYSKVNTLLNEMGEPEIDWSL